VQQEKASSTSLSTLTLPSFGVPKRIGGLDLRGLLVVEGGIDGLGVRVREPGTGRVWMRGLQIKDDGVGGRSGLMLRVRGVSVWRMWRGRL